MSGDWYQPHLDALIDAVWKSGDDIGTNVVLPDVGTVNLPGRAWSVEVYCQEQSHAERPYDIGKFYLRIFSGYPVELWAWEPRRRRHRRGRSAALRRQRQQGTSVFHPGPQHLIGDTLLPEVHNGKFRGVEMRYPLKCNACNLSLPWRQVRPREEDRLQIELDKRAIAGLSRVALSELVARLT